VLQRKQASLINSIYRSIGFASDIERRPLAELEHAMQAMVLKDLRTAVEWTDLPHLPPGPGEIRVKVAACGRRADRSAD
jgi:hypothetical protein